MGDLTISSDTVDHGSVEVSKETQTTAVISEERLASTSRQNIVPIVQVPFRVGDFDC